MLAVLVNGLILHSVVITIKHSILLNIKWKRKCSYILIGDWTNAEYVHNVRIYCTVVVIVIGNEYKKGRCSVWMCRTWSKLACCQLALPPDAAAMRMAMADDDIRSADDSGDSRGDCFAVTVDDDDCMMTGDDDWLMMTADAESCCCCCCCWRCTGDNDNNCKNNKLNRNLILQPMCK